MEGDSQADTGKLLNESDTQNRRPSSNKFTLYPRRWLILAAFSLTSMVNEEIWLSLSTITTTIEKYYSVDPLIVNWLSLIFLLSMAVLLAPCSYFLHTHGLRLTMDIGAFLNAVGSSLRAIGWRRERFAFVFTGSCFCALGQCFLFFLPPHIAAVWFGESERDIASSIGMLMSLSGAGVAFLLSSFFVSSRGTDEKDVGNGLRNLLLFEAISSTALFILCAIVVKPLPPSPPSRSQELRLQGLQAAEPNTQKTRKWKQTGEYSSLEPHADICASGDEDDSSSKTEDASSPLIGANGRDTVAPSFTHDLKMLLKNKTFHILCQAYSIYFGLFTAFATVLNQTITSVFPGEEKQVGYMGFTAGVTGLIATFISGVVITKTRQYRVYAIAVYSLCCVTTIFLFLALHYSGNATLVFIAIAIYGFLASPYVSIGLEYVAETTYPVAENISTSTCLILSCIYGITFTQVLGIALKKGFNISGYFISSFYAIGLLLVLTVKAPLKRSAIDGMHEGSRETNET